MSTHLPARVIVTAPKSAADSTAYPRLPTTPNQDYDMRPLAWPLAAALLAVLTPAVAHDKDDVVKQGAVVALTWGDHGCSGTYIGGRDGLILTAAHCVSSFETNYTVTGDAGVDVQGFARAIIVDKGADLAILQDQFAGAALNSAEIECGPVHLGQAISVHGYPLDLGYIESTGTVSGLPRAYGSWRSVMTLSAQADHGDSGGPVVDAQGRVVGVLVGGFVPYGVAWVFAVPSARACQLLGI